MALYICKDCLEKEGAVSQPLGHAPSWPHLSISRVSPLRACLLGLLGSVIGLLIGNPVAVLVGTASATLASGLVPHSTRDGSPSSDHGACHVCGSLLDVETCSYCGRPACPSHRRLVMAEEECNGERRYRHYERSDDLDEAGSHCLAPWNVSLSDDEEAKPGYRLSDEAYLLDEETGELVAVSPSAAGESAEADVMPSDSWDFEGASVSPTPDEWGDFASWESSNWDAGSEVSESEGGEAE